VSTLAFIGAALKVLPLVLQLIQMFKSSADAKVQRGLGYDQAVKESLEEGAAIIATARQVEAEAAAKHASDPEDTAFDPEFQRKD
jgi:hypothetical protein